MPIVLINQSIGTFILLERVMKPILEYPNYSITKDGEIWSSSRGTSKRLEPPINSSGYQQVSLYKNGKAKVFSVHRLVAEAFIPNPDNLPCVCHKNDVPSDNRAENLFWGTHQDNMKDKSAKNRQVKGAEHGSAKLTEEQVLEIRKIGKSMFQVEIAKIYGIDNGTVSRILSRELWPHI